MVNDTTTGTNKNVNSTSELIGLLIDVASSVNCEDIVLALVELESVELFGNLKSELSCGGQNHCLRSSSAKQLLATEALHHRKTEAQGFSGASKVSYNHVFFAINSPEGHVLNWEECSDATGDQARDSVSINFREV